MRELKFRAWDTGAKRWASGVMPVLTGLSLELKPAHSGIIIEQYTGLKDKNGKEICEGDIVRYGRHIGGIIPPESCTEIVSWWSGEEEYYPCCTTSGFALPYSEDDYEVIGNIHDNPELLDVKEEG